MFVAGNTAHGTIRHGVTFRIQLDNFNNKKIVLLGVYRRKENLQVFIDISGVEELRKHSVGSEIVLGGNVSLTETMEILTNASNRSGFEYAKHLVHHIDLIANVPVRNVWRPLWGLFLFRTFNSFPFLCHVVFDPLPLPHRVTSFVNLNSPLLL